MADDETQNSAAGLAGAAILLAMVVGALYGLWKAVEHFGLSAGGLLTVMIGYPIAVISLGILPWIICTSLFASAGWIEEDDNYVEVFKKLWTKLSNRPSGGSDEEWEAVSVFTVVEYPDYLASEEWAQRRAIMLSRAEYRCHLCNSRKSLQIHHRTYERIGREQIADMMVLCGECHTAHHTGVQKSPIASGVIHG